MKLRLNLGLPYSTMVAISFLLAFVISQQQAVAEQSPLASADAKGSAAVGANASGVVVAQNLGFGSAGAYRVDAALQSWRDNVRMRDVPVKLYFPVVGKTEMLAPTFPVVLFSHGLGGSREGGRRWAEHWASHGYVVVALQHAGSDESLWKGAPPREVAGKMKAGMTLSNLTLRIDDVHFVIDEVTRRTEVGEVAFANADPQQLGMSGHSFGAQTTLAVAGQKSPTAITVNFIDKRIQSAIAFSPNARNQNALPRQFGDIKPPFFSITGTEDGSILDDGSKPEQRRSPFENMPAGQKYLAVFDGGDHMVIGGHGFGLRRPETARDKKIQLDVMAGTLAFWNATLKKDAAARDWLEKGGFRATLSPKDVFEYK